MKVSSDLKMICRGLVLLSIMTVCGVMAAEQQINHLTERQKIVQSFNVVRGEDGAYLAYLFGDPYRMAKSYTVGAISNSDKAVYLSIGPQVYIIPYIYSFSVQGYFDELYRLSYSLKSGVYTVKYWISQSRLNFMTTLNSLAHR
jgi:hypothetical protein